MTMQAPEIYTKSYPFGWKWTHLEIFPLKPIACSSSTIESAISSWDYGMLEEELGCYRGCIIWRKGKCFLRDKKLRKEKEVAFLFEKTKTNQREREY